MMPRRGVSLVEVLVVIGLMGVLVGLTLPAVQRVRAAAARASCLDRLRQIGQALQNHHAAHGRLPPAADPPGRRGPARELSWMAALLPYVERDDLYRDAVRACDLDPNPLHNPPHTAFAAPVASFVCPSDGRLTAPLTDEYGTTAAFTSYVGIAGSALTGTRKFEPGVLGEVPGVRLTDVRDGTSQTVAIGERPPPASLRAGWWYPSAIGAPPGPRGPRGPENLIFLGLFIVGVYDPSCQLGHRWFGPGRLDNSCDRFHLWSLHPGGGNFLFADGSARSLPYSAESVLHPLATRSGGEAVEVPD
jgi:prepilin-type processing-associated H-X9-DG protein/prepilin-type N-terminal cleavage/methylation domain-containing protein